MRMLQAFKKARFARRTEREKTPKTKQSKGQAFHYRHQHQHHRVGILTGANRAAIHYWLGRLFVWEEGRGKRKGKDGRAGLISEAEVTGDMSPAEEFRFKDYITSRQRRWR